MKLIQLFKIHLICSIILVSFSFSRVIKPVGNEDMLKLVVSTDEGNKVRPYYLVDNNGIEYSDFKDFKVGDKVNFQIMSRTYVASNSNSNKKSDALYKIGLCYIKINDSSNAIKAFQKIGIQLGLIN